MSGCAWLKCLNATATVLCYARVTLLFFLIIPLTHAELVSFDYSGFVIDDLKQLKLDGYATFSDSVIQLTLKVMDTNSKWIGSVGRVTSSKHFHLWDKISNEKKDFKTDFSFLVFSNNQSVYGDGLALFLASPNLPNANDSFALKGGALGIGYVDQDSQTFIPAKYEFVAVEFDSYSNPWDPPHPHVGVNVNTMKSDKFDEWLPDIPNGEVYNCSIQYNSRNSILKVSFTGYSLNDGHVTHPTKYFSYHIDITEHLPESVIVGISAAAGDFSEEHTLLSWSFSTSLPIDVDPVKERKLINMLERIGIGLGLSLILLVFVIILLWKMNKRKEEEATSETTSDLKMV